MPSRHRRRTRSRRRGRTRCRLPPLGSRRMSRVPVPSRPRPWRSPSQPTIWAGCERLGQPASTRASSPRRTTWKRPSETALKRRPPSRPPSCRPCTNLLGDAVERIVVDADDVSDGRHPLRPPERLEPAGSECRRRQVAGDLDVRVVRHVVLVAGRLTSTRAASHPCEVGIGRLAQLDARGERPTSTVATRTTPSGAPSSRTAAVFASRCWAEHATPLEPEGSLTIYRRRPRW